MITAERLAALLQARYPDGEITVTPEPGGMRIEVYNEASSMFAVVGDWPSAIVAALQPYTQETP